MIKNEELIKFTFSLKLLENETKILDTPEDLQNSDDYWKKTKIISNQYSLEFPESIILSRIIFEKPSAVRFTYSISNEEKGTKILMKDKVSCKQGVKKVINFHYLPCKFVYFVILNNQPFPSQEQISCYGFDKEYFKEKYGEEMLKTIYYKTGSIIYDGDKKDI